MKTIPIKGVIVPNEDKWIYDWFELDACCPAEVIKALKEADGDEVTFEINSPGGEISAGSELWYSIKTYQNKTIADIVGYACSAASYLSMAANTVRMVPTALMMIHNVSGGANGNKHAMTKEADVLQTADEAISNAYRIKTGMSREEILKLMDDETWMDSTKAQELGFIDEIIGEFNEEKKNEKITGLYNAAGIGKLLSDEVKQKVRNMVKDPDAGLKEGNQDFLIQTKLNLLKLGGDTYV